MKKKSAKRTMRRSPEVEHIIAESGKDDRCILCGGLLAGTVLFNAEVLPFCRPHVRQLGPLLSKVHHAGSPEQHQTIATLNERVSSLEKQLRRAQQDTTGATEKYRVSWEDVRKAADRLSGEIDNFNDVLSDV